MQQDAMGDVLMCGPAMRALRTSLPGCRLTLMTSPAGAAAAALMPEVDETIAFPAPWTKAGADDGGANATLDAAGHLVAERFDAAAIFTAYSQSPLPAALLCALASVPRRLAHCREDPHALLTHWVRESEPEQGVRHEVRRQLDLVETVGARCADERLRVTVPARARAHVNELLGALDVSERWIVVHPGAGAPARRYPPQLLAKACRLLPEHRILFTGDDRERGLVADLRRRLGAADSISLAGRLDLGELAALLERAPLLIAGNTGPVHLAAAVGTPVVELYALTHPQHTPWETPSVVLSNDVPCRFCERDECPEGHHLCLHGVNPRRVARAARRLLEAGDPRSLEGYSRAPVS